MYGIYDVKWWRRLAYVCLCLFTMLIPTATTAQSKSTPEMTQTLNAIDAYLDTQMAELHIPGLALGIVQGDQIVYLQGYGIADPSGRVVTPQTPFILNSISKSFAALAIMQLVEAGRVDLDAPVQQYLPWFAVADATASTQITVRHLLHQTSGLPESASYPEFSRPRDTLSLEARIRALRDVPLNRPVGESFEYTDANYDVLGMIVQAVTGQAYAEYVHQQLLAPLMMPHSETTQPAALPTDLAVGYRSWFSFPLPYRQWFAHAQLPSGDLIATAEDMTHYMIAQLNDGRYLDSTLLSPEGVAALHAPTVRQGDGDKFYGMGWEVRPSNGVAVLRHDGTSANYYADVMLEPQGRWGVVLLLNFNSFNMYGGRIQALSGGVMSLLRGETPPALPAMHHPILFPAMIGIFVISALLAIWIAWLLFARRRGRALPMGWRRYVTVGLPLLLTWGWGLLLLILLPQLLYPLPVLYILVPDFGYCLLVSGVFAITCGLVWLLVVLLAIRTGRAAALPTRSLPANV